MLKILRKFIIKQNNIIRIDKISKITEILQLKTIDDGEKKTEN